MLCLTLHSGLIKILSTVIDNTLGMFGGREDSRVSTLQLKLMK